MSYAIKSDNEFMDVDYVMWAGAVGVLGTPEFLIHFTTVQDATPRWI